jgi:serine/threonine protein kinase
MITPCPDDRELERLLLGRVPAAEAEPLEQHLATCSRCAVALEKVRTTDPLVDALQRPPVVDETKLGPFVAALLPSLKQLRPEGPKDTTPFAGLEEAETAPGFEYLAPRQADDELGRLGSYRVLRPLGSGGMGMVFVADDLRLKRRVALKVIKPELVQLPDVRARFLREAQAIARVEHENIVAIYQVDEDRGVPFLAMPLLRGESLEERLGRADGPLPLDETLRIAREVAAGLSAAHGRGLVHRDIKPGNIFLSVGQGAGGEDTAVLRPGDPPPLAAPVRPEDAGSVKVKILDFGLARAVRADDPEVSQLGTIAGTPAYMAPEQGRGQVVDHRADLFSFGCVLYRMTTGQPAFRGSDLFAVVLSVAEDHPPSPRKLNPAVPLALARLIDKLLAKKPENRPPSAQAVVEAIDALERERDAARRPKPSRRRWLVLAAMLVLAAAGAGAWLMRRAAPVPPEEPGEVTFAFDEPGVTLLIRRGEGEEKVLDLEGSRTHKLAPGTYRVRAQKVPWGGLTPDLFDVKAAEAKTVKLRLIGQRMSTGKSHDRAVLCVAATPKKGEVLIVSASRDASVGVWAPFPNNALTFFGQATAGTGHTSEVHAVAFAPDGSLVASGGGGRDAQRADMSIRLWDPHRREQLDQLTGHTSWVEALAFAPDGKHLLSGARDGTIYLWHLKAKGKPEEWQARDGQIVHAVAFSADGTRALTGGENKQAILWDVARGQKLKGLDVHRGPVRGVAFGPGANEATTACEDGKVRIWQWETGKVRELAGHDRGVYSVAVSPDGRRLLSGGADGTVRLWDAPSGTEVCKFPGHEREVNSVAFTADGRWAVSGGTDQTVRLWGLPE